MWDINTLKIPFSRVVGFRSNKMDKVDIETSLKAYRLVNPGLVFLVTVGDGEKDNVFACAWNLPVRKEPGMVGILTDKGHYSYSLLTRTWEFGINIPGASLKDAVYGCGSTSGRDVDKFSRFGLTRWKARMIAPPLIKEAVAHIECRVCQVVDMGDTVILLAHILAASVDPLHFKNSEWVFDNGLELLHHIGGNKFAVSSGVVCARET